MIGGFEALLGSSLYFFLVQYKLLPKADEGHLTEIFHTLNPLYTLVIVAVIIFVLRFLQQVLPTYAVELYSSRLRHAVSRRILFYSTESHGFSVADVNNILGNFGPRSCGLVVSFSNILATGFTFLTVVAVLISLSWQLTLLSFGAGMVLGIPGILIRNRGTKFQEFVSNYTAVFTEKINKAARNVHFLKVSGANEEEMKTLSGLVDDIVTNAMRWHVRFAAKINLPALAAILIGTGIVLTNSLYGFATLTDLVPFVYLLSRTAGALTGFVSAVAQAEFAYPFAKRLARHEADLLDEGTSEVGSLVIPTGRKIDTVEVRELVVGRENSLLVPTSFAVNRGQMLLLKGESGCGKTTMLMTVIGVVRSLGGDIRWNGLDINDLNPESLRKRIGYTSPDPFLFDGDIRQNILFGLYDKVPSDKAIKHALWCANAAFVERLPQGLSHKLSEGGEGLSAGQRQRLSLARSLLREPDVLLLDEATANIDEKSEKIIMERIFATYPEMIVIAVSHRASMEHYASVTLSLSPVA